MSTIDPAVAREERARSREGSAKVATVALLLLVIGLAGAVATGLGFGFLVSTMRDSAINSIFADTETTFSIAAPGLMAAAFTIAALPFAVLQLRAYRGRRNAGWWVLGLGIACFAGGLALSVPWWSEPLEVGVAVDPVFHDDDPWSPLGWAMYYSSVWLPVLLFTLAAAVTVGCYRDGLRSKAQDAELDRLLREGARTVGTLTEVLVHYSTNSEGGRSVAGATGTVRYVDLHGQERFVVRRSPRAEVVSVGREVHVVYDPRHPELDASIFVAFVGRPILTDWLGGRWRRTVIGSP
jgi:Protein of unknown function (DUF3592)